MKNKFRIIAVAFISLVCLCAGIDFIVGTQKGLEAVFTFVGRLLPGKLRVVGLQGRLAGPLHFEKLEYHTKGMRFSMTHVTVDWQGLALLRGNFTIQSLAIDRLALHYTQAITTHSDAQSFSPLISRLLKRIKLQDATLREGIFNIDDKRFELKGSLHQQWYWKLALPLVETRNVSDQNSTLMLEGTIKGSWRKREPNLEFYGSSQAVSVMLPQAAGNTPNQLLIPATQWKSCFNAKGLDFKLALKCANPKQSDRLTAWLTLPYYQGEWVPKHDQLIQIGAQARLSDCSPLRDFLPPTISAALVKASGILTVDFQYESTLAQLQACLWEPEARLFKHCATQKAEPSKAVLAINLYSPNIPKVGLYFKKLFVQAKLDQGKINWYAKLTPFETELPAYLASQSKWLLTGQTQFQWAPLLSKAASEQARLQFTTQMHLVGEALPLFTGTIYEVALAPNVTIDADNKQINLQGTVHLATARLNLGSEADDTIQLDEDVYFVEEGQMPIAATLNQLPFYTKLNITLGDNVRLLANGLEAGVKGEVFLTGSSQSPFIANGELNLVAGCYRYYGQKLNIEEGARLIFTEQLIDNPRIDITASRLVQVKSSTEAALVEHSAAGHRKQAKVGLHVRGNLYNPQIQLFSEPAMAITDPTDQLAYLVMGHPISELSSAGAHFLWDAASSLGSDVKELNKILIKLQKKTGLDQISLQSDLPSSEEKSSENQNFMKNTALVLGKQLTSRLSVFYRIALLNNANQALKIHYILDRHLSLEGSLGNSGTGIALLYQADKE